MIRIFRSLIYSTIGMASLSWISIIFIILCIAGPDPDGAITAFIADTIIHQERIEQTGWTFAELADDIFALFAFLNINLLSITIIASLAWSVVSHYLNINAPGKAKIYFIHWIIFTGGYLAIIIGLAIFFTNDTLYESAQYISKFGTTLVTAGSAIFYFFIYYVGVVLGTARFARSSVLFANKLPGNL